jgi:hypothetical protein
MCRSTLRSFWDRYEVILVILMAFFCGAALRAFNAQAGDYPLLAILAVVLADRAIHEIDPGLSRQSVESVMFIVMLTAVSFLPMFLNNLAGVGYGALTTRHVVSKAGVPRFSQSHLRSLVLLDSPEQPEPERRNSGTQYVTYVNTGVNLLQRYTTADETIFTLDMINPFPYALLRHPESGGSTCMSGDNSFADNAKPSAGRLLDRADIVMIPKHPSASDITEEELLRNYSAEVKSRFQMCAETTDWLLYKHPSKLAGCPAQFSAMR